MDGVVQEGYATTEQAAKNLGNDEAQCGGHGPAKNRGAQLRMGMPGTTVGVRVSGVTVGMGVARSMDMCTHEAPWYASAAGNAASGAGELLLVRQFDTGWPRKD